MNKAQWTFLGTWAAVLLACVVFWAVIAVTTNTLAHAIFDTLVK